MLNRIRRPHYKGCHQKVQQKKSMKRRMMATTTRRMTLRWGSDCQVLAVSYGCSCTIMTTGLRVSFFIRSLCSVWKMVCSHSRTENCCYMDTSLFWCVEMNVNVLIFNPCTCVCSLAISDICVKWML